MIHLTLMSQLTVFSQAYTIIAVFNCMRMSMGLLPFSVKATAEAKVALARLKVCFVLSHFFTLYVKNNNHHY